MLRPSSVGVARICLALSVAVATGVVLAATVGALDSPSTTAPATPAIRTPTIASGVTTSDRDASSTATRAYRATLAQDAGRLVADVQRIATAVDAHDLAGAQSADLAAQADFDQLRAVDAADPQNAAGVDALAGQVLTGDSFGGLHGVERALWSGGDASALLPSLEEQTVVTRELMARQTLSPVTIASVAVSELDWVVDQALPGREEQYSHLDLVDVAAGVAGAQQAFTAVQPLACAVEPAACRGAATDLDAVRAAVASLGPASSVPDAALTSPVRRAISQKADAAANALAGLEAPLVRFGAAGPQPYGAGGAT
ncbi:MAG: hypothetical protein JO368_09355 [Acidimicrobiales bacterium]|nr:hypothetical protein [Acidimicrobiales bacterium]